MKRVLLVALATMLLGGGGAEQAMAQKFELGVRAGVGSQNMNVESLGLFMNGKARLGWNVAAVTRIRLIGFGDGILGAGLFFQPEVVYSQSSIKGNHSVFSPAGDAASTGTVGPSAKLRMKTVDVPLMLSLKVSLVRVQAGPVINLMNNLSEDGKKLELLPLRAPVGYALGASADLFGLTLDARYHGEFKKLKYTQSGLEEFKSSLSSWSIGVGIMF